VVFLFIEMPFSEYDVNVHPTKVEVRFYNSNLVHSQVLGVLRERLLGTNLTIAAQLPPGEPSSTDSDVLGRDLRRQQIADAMADFFKRHRPVHQQQQFDLRAESTPDRRDSSYRKTVIDRPAAVMASEFHDRKYLQIHDSYIIEQTDEGFVIIDQHALHERMMYEILQRRLQRESLESQRLLLPESLDVSEAQAGAIENHAEVLAQLGIELTSFGPRTFAIQTFPTMLGDVPPVEFVQGLLDLLVEHGGAMSKKDLFDSILNMVACKAAIKAGRSSPTARSGNCSRTASDSNRRAAAPTAGPRRSASHLASWRNSSRGPDEQMVVPIGGVCAVDSLGAGPRAAAG